MKPRVVVVNRGAYCMSNWGGQLDAVRKTGTLQTMYPADLLIPMVAPLDLGEIAAQRLVSTPDDTGIRYVGVRDAIPLRTWRRPFCRRLARPWGVDVITRDKWKETFQGLGFSEAAADSDACMTAISLDGGFDMPDDAMRGATTLEAYIRVLAKA